MSGAEPIRYTVDLSRRRQHLLEVTTTVPADCAAGARLVLPTWTPGSYVVRDYAHHLQWIRARDAGGTRLDLAPDGLSAWHLPDDVDGAVTVTTELYANDLTVRTNHVDDHHALVVPAATFLHVDGHRDRPHMVSLPAPDGQEVFALLPAGDEAGTYVADDAWHLVDGAFEVGHLPHLDYTVHGVPHRFVWAGHGGRPDLERVTRDATAIAEAAVALFGGELPVDAYTFLCLGWDSGGGGLEHRDGAVIQIPVRVFQDDDLYRRFQSLLAHEYLHLWNGKRLVPAELLSPDLERPAHSTALWVAEGWTEYYDDVVSLRAGVWTLAQLLERQRDLLRHVEDTPGHELLSLREAGYRAWTKLYVRDENWRNSVGDYYRQGALVAWCLDLLLRGADPDGDGLDAVLRTLWSRFGGQDGPGPRDGARGYTEHDVQAAVEDAAADDLAWFFDRYVAGRELPPVEDLVGNVGLRLVPDDDPATPYLGVETSEDDAGVTIDVVLRDRPAWRAGVTGGDRLLAIDELRVGRGELDAALRAHAPGDTVDVTVFRGPRLLTLPVTLGEPRPPRRLTAVEEASDAQRTAFRRWTGRDLSEAT